MVANCEPTGTQLQSYRLPFGTPLSVIWRPAGCHLAPYGLAFGAPLASLNTTMPISSYPFLWLHAMGVLV